MITDNENYFTTGPSSLIAPGFVPSQLLPTAVATTALTNVIDSGPLGGQNTQNSVPNLGRDFGMGYPMLLYVTFPVAPTSGGAATIDLQIVSSASSSLTSPNVMLDVTGGALAYNGGKFSTTSFFKVYLPRSGPYNATTNPGGWLRYIGINAIIGTAALTGGSIIAALVRDVQDNTFYQAGFTLS